MWALRHLDVLESAQLVYFKRIFQLPWCTPNYLLRLEVGLAPIAVRIFELTVGWIIKILEMDDSRLPKICFLRHLALFKTRPAIMDNKTAKRYELYNWIYQVNFFMEKISASGMWDNVNSVYWKSKKDDMVARLLVVYKQEDLGRVVKSESLQVVIPRTLSDGPALYLRTRAPWKYIRTVAQARLSTIHAVTFSFKGIFYKIDPTKKCNLCNLNEVESLAHLFLRCPIYVTPRRYWLNCVSAQIAINASDSDDENLLTVLLQTNLGNKNALKNIHYFIKNAIKIRTFHLEY